MPSSKAPSSLRNSTGRPAAAHFNPFLRKASRCTSTPSRSKSEGNGWTDSNPCWEASSIALAWSALTPRLPGTNAVKKRRFSAAAARVALPAAVATVRRNSLRAKVWGSDRTRIVQQLYQHLGAPQSRQRPAPGSGLADLARSQARRARRAARPAIRARQECSVCLQCYNIHTFCSTLYCNFGHERRAYTQTEAS